MLKTGYAKISSENVRLLLKKNRMSVRQLAEKIDIAPTTLNDSLKSKKGIAIDSLIGIAEYFDLTVNDLCSENFYEEYMQENIKSKDQLYKKYQELDDYGKMLVSTVLDMEAERTAKQLAEKKPKMPTSVMI